MDLRGLYRAIGGQLPEEIAVCYMAQMCSALCYLRYNLQMVHRNINPSTVGAIVPVDDAGDPVLDQVTLKLLSFTTAMPVDRSNEDNWARGHPRYISTEDLADTAASAEVDAFALGTVSYEFVFRRQAGYNTVGDLFASLANRSAFPIIPLERLNDDGSEAPPISRDLEDALRYLLARNRDDRMDLAALADHDLFVRWGLNAWAGIEGGDGGFQGPGRRPKSMPSLRLAARFAAVEAVCADPVAAADVTGVEGLSQTSPLATAMYIMSRLPIEHRVVICRLSMPAATRADVNLLFDAHAMTVASEEPRLRATAVAIWEAYADRHPGIGLSRPGADGPHPRRYKTRLLAEMIWGAALSGPSGLWRVWGADNEAGAAQRDLFVLGVADLLDDARGVVGHIDTDAFDELVARVLKTKQD